MVKSLRALFADHVWGDKKYIQKLMGKPLRNWPFRRCRKRQEIILK
jgi:hypothetical protein